MTVTTPKLGLPKGEGPDNASAYLKGSIPGGGLWHALEVLDNAILTTASITLDDVTLNDPTIVGWTNAQHAHADAASAGSTLGPGTTLATPVLQTPSIQGEATFAAAPVFQADATVRDTLYFGEQGTALAAETWLQRASGGILLVGNTLQVTGALDIRKDATQRFFSVMNAAGQPYWGWGTNDAAGNLDFYAYDPVGTFKSVPLSISRTTGTVTLTPAVGAAHLTGGSTLHLDSSCLPLTDNARILGGASNRWNVVYSATGTINTSSADLKEGITPLSPIECYEAAKQVRWYEYAYRPPAYTPPEPPPDIAYDAADDNATKAEKKAARDEAEAASKAAYARMLVETAPARNQRGFVFPVGASAKDEAGGALPPVPDLFGLSDRESTTPQADLATLGAALQEVIRRLELLEGAAA